MVMKSKICIHEGNMKLRIEPKGLGDESPKSGVRHARKKGNTERTTNAVHAEFGTNVTLEQAIKRRVSEIKNPRIQSFKRTQEQNPAYTTPM